MAGLKINNVTKSFGNFDALSDVTLDIKNGEFVAVLGPSGCGKTTLLRAIAGFEKITSGAIQVGDNVMSAADRHVEPENRRVGIVFQNYALWPHMTVAENVGYSLRVARVAKPELERRVTEALTLVDLTGLGDRRPASLSGGQRQRVALARCLVAAPSLVLFDEPLANLDVHLRASMEDEFASFHKRTGTTIVYITHDQAEAMALADRIAVMDRGKLIQFATPRELYERPQSEMVASFIAHGMVLPAQVIGAEKDGQCAVEVLGQKAVMRCVPGQAVQADAKICIRSQNIELCDDTGIALSVRRRIYRGGGARIEACPVNHPSTELTFDLADGLGGQQGETIHIAINSGWVIPDGASR
ncbi:ABC transporter ATP-binding protein [Brucella pseudogrignonensis]|uniref:ABC transporter family protein n=1 Tax=Brucella pseudogrignonensis TaxID=419475 RepID=A0A256G9Q7_9HYPH|nr:ABC transporter ATP-binding protein [Brucella pseudogrignonensis]EMG51422.1 ABC transporter-like protein [Ochrobactrum sp. CDB2]MQP40369.1 ATP-binding cassette domain-containing protein [Ochrobactrum sp. MYb237]OYR23676.1 ABC transporter family protein [Brucella pseudogrignonensis]PQZ39449.1 ABC transporter ATP-binding protein [Brucella pseudogrignonensis]PRA41048.1 ABC transporter ATP-binding protein [Brucella pseudogrignonensis]